MRRGLLPLVAALVAIMLPMGAADAAPPAEDGASGRITFRPHTHSSEFGSPSGTPTMVATEPVPFPITEGSFSYSSIECDVPAPFNEVSLNFTPDYPGIEDPASTRSIIDLTVTDAEAGTVEGTVTMFLCENGQEGDQIVYAFAGQFHNVSDNLAAFTGTFDIVSGTGTFAGIEGEGRFRGAITCLGPVLASAGAEDCADLGAYSDAVLTLRGSFSDPTVG